ncbi:MAG: alpha/beta hydrolase [Xanthobacteraceae bacterium]|jgi:pimeloyl-ACP methyl ester carboxylesterase|nr:alpha/beta hydrolase [Xanthobacteraceae bacterium]
MKPPLFVQQFGDEAGKAQKTLVLLHGLGMNGDVWQRLLARLGDWSGRIIVPDLRGHGRSPHASSYSDQDHAADVADLLPREGDVYILGHSMGGMVALSLTSGRFPVAVQEVFAFGVKAVWAEDELGKIKTHAQAPARRFESRVEVADRFLKVAGLNKWVDADATVVEAGILRDEAGYRLAADPRTAMVAGTSLAETFHNSKVQKRLACGNLDPLVTIEQLRAIDPAAIDLGPYGHNIQVENPEQLVEAAPFLRN